MRYLIFLPFPMAVGMALSGVEVLMSVWAARTSPAPASDGGVVLSVSLVGTGGENSDYSG